MGMWDKDVLYGGERLDKHVHIGESSLDAEKVLLLDIRVVSKEVPTDIGMATKTELLICKLGADGTTIDGEPFAVNTLASAIGAKAEEADPGDMPAVVNFFVVENSKEGFNDATVMQLVSRWDGKVPKFTPLS